MKKLLLLVVAGLLLAGCGGGGTPSMNPAGQDLALTVDQVVGGSGFNLGVLKDVNGVPQGVRISWTRVNVPGVLGYYIYRDSSTIPAGNPSGHSALRIDAGGTSGMKDQYGTGTQTLTHDDIFTPPVGNTYYYRITVVNSTSDESDFSSELNITIAQHAIISISPQSGSIGDTITITGEYFSSQEAGDKVYFTNSSGSTNVEATITSWGDTSIDATVPYGAADGDIGVEIGGTLVYTPSGQEFDYNEPAITNISPTSDWVDHDYITLTGTDFGPTSELGVGTDVYFAGTAATDYDTGSSSDTTILCKVPAAAVGAATTVYVSVAGNDSGTTAFTILPHIDSISPGSGNTGATLTITGTNFGATQGTGGVTVNAETAAITSWTNSSVVVTIPAAAVDGDVVLTRDDTNTTNGGGFDVVPTFGSFGNTRRQIGENLIINGSGFGATQGSSTVTFDGGSIAVVTYNSWSENSISVVVPTGAETGAVTISIVDADVTGGSDIDSVTSGSNITVVLAPPTLQDIDQI